ncbi:5-hydroxytryptamine receptor 3A-like [Rhinoderma darwinii]|uniref:5-hydroxytryptamine receptor 3A-like n=1 Tax=Rhinoderma darwinii TaxID=43563 RepID=UPI003F67FF20
MFPRHVFLWLPFILFDTCQCESACSFQNLLKTIDFLSAPNVRPVKNWRTASEVYLDLTLYTIINLDMSKQTAIIYIWFYMSWKDEFISWNPDDFCGIKKMFVSSDYFWKPDMYIYEMIDSDDKSPEIPYYGINNNGKIVNAMPLRIVSACNLDVLKFPFDNQTCRLSFGSYIYTVSDIIMLPKSNSSMLNQNSLDVFTSKGDWVLQAVMVHERSYVSEGEEFNQVIYSIYIRRNPMIYVLNLIIPACFLVFLDIASMFIQSYGERLGFKITIVFGFSVLLLILNDMLPIADNTPMLGIFCCICLAMMVLSIIGTITTSYMLEQSNTNPHIPIWIQKFILKHLSRVLCFKTAITDELVIVVTPEPGKARKDKTDKVKEVRKEKKPLDEEMNNNQEVKVLKKLLLQILKIHDELTLAKKEKESRSDWVTVAVIVDRLVLILDLITVSLVFIIMICIWAI